ncbi:hypothetical protein HMN09_00090100 [Mycena chlorophos]|uniref:triacylglycerol lipase n=1 Tax=Mycena chlorophos TaxID=658473 RepID=A0A8H6WLK0_MYCCL|nr:hypothetical protein HMN09_00090100 [Mycena chlorophos]
MLPLALIILISTAADALRTTPTTVYRPVSQHAFQSARRRSLQFDECESLDWTPHVVQGPDLEDRHTIAQLARMAGNAYAYNTNTSSLGNWYELDPAWQTSFPVGWEEGEGFRGHVFLSNDNNTLVLAIKGTTLQGPTSKQDKFNDNLLFSCCFCDCYRKSWRCDNTCLSKALIEDSLFYNVGVNLVNDIFMIHPNANVWLVGHSLGGALAALLGATFGLPAVAFEAPGERLAAQRLHLPMPILDGPLWPAITHVYHNADPIPQGTCTGIGSLCAQGGYALETRCHLGKSIVFDTVNKLGWKVDVRKHVIKNVIQNVLELEDVEWEEGKAVPVARAEKDCVDCFKWDFGEYDD